MTRKIVSRAELNDWLTNELCKVEDCEGSSLSVKYLLAEPDDEGCNWSGLSGRPGPHTSGEHMQPIMADIAGRARALFNLAA